MAAVQAAIPVARLSETEGSSNAVGGLEISAAIVTSRTGAGLAPTAACSESTKRVGPGWRLCPCQFALIPRAKPEGSDP